MDGEPPADSSESDGEVALRERLVREIERARQGGRKSTWESRPDRERRMPTSFALTDEERTELRVQSALRGLSQSRTIGALLKEAAHRGGSGRATSTGVQGSTGSSMPKAKR